MVESKIKIDIITEASQIMFLYGYQNFLISLFLSGSLLVIRFSTFPMGDGQYCS